jgi:hypothetical protein
MTDDNERQGLVPLVHSDIRVPHNRLRVTSLDQMERANGVAFNATLSLDGRTIGAVENDGNGGATWLRSPNNLFGWKAMAAFTDSCRRHGKPVTEDEILNALIDEYDTDQLIRAATAAGNTLLRLRDTDGNVLHLIEVPGTQHSIEAVGIALGSHLAAHPDTNGAMWQIWTGDNWKTLNPVPATAAHQAPIPAPGRTDPHQPQHAHVTVQLAGRDGNAYAIIGAVAHALRRHVSTAAADQFTTAAQACTSYDALIQLAMATVTVA